MEEIEEGFNLEQQKAILKNYGKAFLNDTIKYYKKTELSEKDQEKWQQYNKYFFEATFTHEKEIQEIREEYQVKYIYILFLLSEYDQAKEGFDRKNLKTEVVLSDILLKAKEEKIKKMHLERITTTKQKLGLLDDTFSLFANNQRFLKIPASAIEYMGRNINLEGKKIKEELEALEQISKELNTEKFEFAEYMKQKDYLEGIEALIDISVEDYIKGLAIEKILDYICKTEELTEKPKKDMLKLNSFLINQLRLEQLLEEVNNNQDKLEKQIYSIKRIVSKYLRIGTKKSIKGLSDIIESEFEKFKAFASLTETNSLIEKQFEMQPYFKLNINKVIKVIKDCGGC